jgi:hypothetical protein
MDRDDFHHLTTARRPNPSAAGILTSLAGRLVEAAVFGRLVGYEDENDAERRCDDPVIAG